MMMFIHSSNFIILFSTDASLFIFPSRTLYQKQVSISSCQCWSGCRTMSGLCERLLFIRRKGFSFCKYSVNKRTETMMLVVLQCVKRHVLECPEFSNDGTCPRGKRCPLKHRRKRCRTKSNIFSVSSAKVCF